jgi:hypothetical protein
MPGLPKSLAESGTCATGKSSGWCSRGVRTEGPPGGPGRRPQRPRPVSRRLGHCSNHPGVRMARPPPLSRPLSRVPLFKGSRPTSACAWRARSIAASRPARRSARGRHRHGLFLLVTGRARVSSAVGPTPEAPGRAGALSVVGECSLLTACPLGHGHRRRGEHRLAPGALGLPGDAREARPQRLKIIATWRVLCQRRRELNAASSVLGGPAASLEELRTGRQPRPLPPRSPRARRPLGGRPSRRSRRRPGPGRRRLPSPRAAAQGLPPEDLRVRGGPHPCRWPPATRRPRGRALRRRLRVARGGWRAEQVPQGPALTWPRRARGAVGEVSLIDGRPRSRPSWPRPAWRCAACAATSSACSRERARCARS